MCNFTTASLPKTLPTNLTNLELLTYAVINANCKNVNGSYIIELKPEQLNNFLSSPTQTKINTLVKKGILNKLDKHLYSVQAHRLDGYSFESNSKYKDTKALLYGLLKSLGNTGVTAEQLSSIINCHPSTITKTLKNTPGVYGISHWLNNSTGGKYFKWYIGNINSKSHPSRPSYILYHKDITDEFDSLKEKITAAYIYTIKLLGIEADITELNYILKDKINKKDLENLWDKIDSNIKLTSKAIRIPLYSNFKGLQLIILALVSEYRLRGMNAIWSLNTFTDMYGITTKESYLTCKLLIKKKLLSKPSPKIIEKWKAYTGRLDNFKSAVTVTKEQNIILNFCQLKPRSS